MTKIHNMSIIFAAGGLQLTCGAILLSWFWPERAFINYNYFTVYKSSSLNLKIVWSKRVSFFAFLRCRKFIRRSHGSSLFVYWEVMPFAFIKMSGWKLIALFYIQIMSSDIQNQLLQLILKSWHNCKPINKMDLQRDRNCSYWKESRFIQ